MSTIPQALREKTIFHVPVGQGQQEAIAVANDRVDAAIVAAAADPMGADPRFLDAAERFIAEDRFRSRRIFVTSPCAADGKTRTAIHLAAALATPDKPVLLAEINFSRPSFRRLLGELRFPFGIEMAVSGEASPADTVIQVGESGLHLAAIRRPGPSEGIERRLTRLQDFFRWANDNYEYLVLDCPAVVSPDWHRWFHEFVGEALLVVREDRTAVADLSKANRLLGQNLTAAWFNRNEKTRGSFAPVRKKVADPAADVRAPQAYPETIRRPVTNLRVPAVPGMGWSREGMRAVSLLMAYASDETKAGWNPEDGDFPAAPVKQ